MTVDDLSDDGVERLCVALRRALRTTSLPAGDPAKLELVAVRPRRYQRGNVRVRHVPKWMRFDVLKRDGYRCRYCGAGVEDGVKLQVDHVIPWTQDGLTTMDNLVTACQPCNIGKMTGAA